MSRLLVRFKADARDTACTWERSKREQRRRIPRRCFVDTLESGARSSRVGISFDVSELLWLMRCLTVNILYNRGVAFLTFANEMQAQFAREAMANQSMDGDEILNVR